MSLPGYRHHIFVCENLREPGHPRGSCAEKGSPDMRAALNSEIASRNLKGIIRANKAGCLDYCEQGPCMVIYPEGVWYAPRTAADIKEIMSSHIDEGKVVSRLLLNTEKP